MGDRPVAKTFILKRGFIVSSLNGCLIYFDFLKDLFFIVLAPMISSLGVQDNPCDIPLHTHLILD